MEAANEQETPTRRTRAAFSPIGASIGVRRYRTANWSSSIRICAWLGTHSSSDKLSLFVSLSSIVSVSFFVGLGVGYSDEDGVAWSCEESGGHPSHCYDDGEQAAAWNWGMFAMEGLES
jgi:hypothetical protein